MKFVGMDQITWKTVTKAARCKLIKFFFLAIAQGWVAQSMVSFNHWLSSIKTNTLSRYLTLVNANHTSSNWTQTNCPLFLQEGFNGIKPLWDKAEFPKLIIFFKNELIVCIACYFAVFMMLKTLFQNISKTLSYKLFKLCYNWGNYGRYKLP